jgi:hypothetical protein
MPKLTCTSTFGNFGWTATADVTQEIADVLASKGLLQILQRSPASEAEKVLAGYEKRPKNFERKEIPFSEANSKTLAKYLGADVTLSDEDDKTVGVVKPAVTVKFHEIGAASAPKFVEEKQIADKHVKAGDFSQWMHDTIKFDAVAADLEDETKAAAVLGAIKAYKVAMLKTL